MDHTRQIKTFIGAMMLAAVSAAGYAGFVSHTPHPYFALAILALAAATSRMKVKLPGINGNMSVNLPFLLTAVANLSAAEAIVVTGVSTGCTVLAAEGCKVQPAANDVQSQHDGICHFTGQPHLPCLLAPSDAVEFYQSGIRAGDGHLVLGTDGAGGRHCRGQRGKIGGNRVVEHGSPLVPVLCSECRSHLNGPGDEFAPWLGTGARRIPGDVRNPPVLSIVLRTDGTVPASGRSGQSGRGRCVRQFKGQKDGRRSLRLPSFSLFWSKGTSRRTRGTIPVTSASVRHTRSTRTEKSTQKMRRSRERAKPRETS